MTKKPTHDSIPADWEIRLQADKYLPWLEGEGEEVERLTEGGANLVLDIAELLGIDARDRYTLLANWADFIERFRTEQEREPCKVKFCPRCDAAILTALGYVSLMKAIGAMEMN